MASTPKSLIRGAFVLAVAGALGLGATQAIARPVEAASSSRTCQQCVNDCALAGCLAQCVGAGCYCLCN